MKKFFKSMLVLGFVIVFGCTGMPSSVVFAEEQYTIENTEIQSTQPKEEKQDIEEVSEEPEQIIGTEEQETEFGENEENTEKQNEETNSVEEIEESNLAAETYLNLNGICYQIRKNGIDAGVAFDSNASNVEFRWMSYNLDTGNWEQISDWYTSNWVTWHPIQGNYWLYVEARTADGVTQSYTISFAVDRDYVEDYIDLSGMYWIVRDTQIDVGIAYESAVQDIQFRWMSYNLDTGTWEQISDWYSGNWVTWHPGKGNYWLHVEAKNSSGRIKDYTICFAVGKNYTEQYVNLSGICVQREGRNVNLGAAYTSSESGVEFKWEVYDLSTRQWTTITDWTGANWTTWRPRSGNYWVNVTARISNGESTSYCTGISLNMGEVHSKKGIEGNYGIYSDPDLNVTNVLENTHLNTWISDTPTSESYVYNGQTYYFNANPGLDDEVRRANSKGIKISLVLLMPWDSNHKNMIIPYAWDGGGHTYYALNGYEPQVQALFGYLAQHYGQPDCHIDNWILGNEVNMPNHYHYTGTLDVNTNASIYAEEYRALYNALQASNPYGKAYISLDHTWTHNDEGRGIGSRDFLYAFYYAINSKQANVNWNIAYHLYTPIMTSSRMWAPEYARYTPQDENAEFISAVNLNVLTNFVQNHFGASTRIILSEQGFDCHEGTQYQAAALAYTFYAAQFNDMVDAVIFRTYKPDYNDGIFDFGLKDAMGNPREAYHVFKGMDTSDGPALTNQYLSVIGINSWNDVVPNYRSDCVWE